MPKAYILAQIDVPDAEAYRASGYMAMAEASVAEFGGRFMVRGGNPQMLESTVGEGAAGAGRVVILEFPSREAALAFYRSESYAPAITLRQSLSTGRLVLLDEHAVP